MRYGSICSGVEAATLAWGGEAPTGESHFFANAGNEYGSALKWEPVFFAEVEPFPCAVLMQKFGATKPRRPLNPAHANSPKEKKQRENWLKQINKFPEGGAIPNLGDFTKIRKDDYEGEIDLLVGGTCCQSFSIAGLRKGLEDPRGLLTLEFAKLAYRARARWLVWENVPSVLSSQKGKDFAQFISLLCGWEVKVPVLKTKKNGEKIRGWKNSGIVTPAPGGYGLAWRVLDAQFVRVDGYPRAVPQRRRRIFVVAYIGDWTCASAVLFDEESLHGNSKPIRKKGQGTACGFEVGPSGGRQSEVSATLDTKCKDGAIRNQTGMLCMAQGQGNAEVCEEKAPTLNCNHEAPIVCLNNRPQEFKTEDEINYPLRASDYKQPPIVCYENHANDSRIKEVKDGVSPQINARLGTGGCNGPLLKIAGFLPGQGKKAGSIGYESDIAPTLRSGCESYGVVKSYGIAENIINRKVKNGGNGIGVQEELQYTLNTSGPHGVCHRSTVRRLMPIECERLMGFPDNHTRIEWNGKPEEECPDSHRYKACGNSFCVNCMRYIGMRIQMVENLIQNMEKENE